MSLLVENCEGFEWDEGNVTKNWEKHRVSWNECEEVFFNQPLLMAEDPRHSNAEQRYYVLGQTDEKRSLFIAFAIRNKRIRIISARDMNRNERKIYNEAAQKNPQV